MRRTVFLLLTLALLTVPVCAVQLPGELLDALPEEAAALAEGEGITEEGVQLLVQSFFDALRASLDRSLRGAVLLALTVLLTGAADGFASSLGENASRFVPLVGVLCVTTLSAGDLSSLIGLGTATMQDLADLTKLLLPTMAAALAGCGGVFTASAWQVGTLFAADALTTLIHELLLPLVYCHIALASEGGVRLLVQSFFDALRASLDRSLRGAVLLALTVLLTGAADGFASSLGENASRFVPLVGVLCVTTLSAGDLSSLIGLGTATMQDLADLTKLLLPTMAAALAGCGGVFTASAWQVGTLFAADALTTLIHELLLPLVYCHIALASAGAALPESGLDKLADGLKKLISWLLCGAVTAFTLYLSVSGVLTGSADRAAVKAAQTAVSGAVPVVGSILAESAEMVLSAAHSLRAAIGAAGVLGVLLACLAPLVRLSVQFLLYRAAAFVSAVSGVKPLERLLEQLGDAFALVLGMTAACAALLLAALLVSISMVVM